MNRLALAFCAALPATVHAHEGHGSTTAASLAHYLAEPMHAAPIIIAAAVIIGWALWRKAPTRD